MAVAARAFVLLSLLVGCSHDTDGIASTFKAEDGRAREIGGIVYRGEAAVPGTLVRIETAEGISLPLPPLNVLTDIAGSYGGQPVAAVSFRYDTTTLFDDAIVTYRGLANRFFTQSLDVPDRTPPRSYRIPLEVHFDTVIPADHDIALFAAGDKAFGVLGTFGSSVEIVTLAYQVPATIHAVEYVRGKDLSTAVAHAKTTILPTPDATAFAALHLEPITNFVDATLEASVPLGYPAPATGEVLVSYSRTSFAHYADFPLNRVIHFPFIPDSGMNYRVRATDGASSMDSGEKSFAVFDKAPTVAPLFVLPETRSPADGETLATGTVLDGRGQGVLEHVLTPEKSGPEIRIIVAQGSAKLPNFTDIGMTPPSGRYAWRVRSYPQLAFVDQLGGVDVRRFQPMSTSAPRTIVLP